MFNAHVIDYIKAGSKEAANQALHTLEGANLDRTLDHILNINDQRLYCERVYVLKQQGF